MSFDKFPKQVGLLLFTVAIITGHLTLIDQPQCSFAPADQSQDIFLSSTNHSAASLLLTNHRTSYSHWPTTVQLRSCRPITGHLSLVDQPQCSFALADHHSASLFRVDNSQSRFDLVDQSQVSFASCWPIIMQPFLSGYMMITSSWEDFSSSTVAIQGEDR